MVIYSKDAEADRSFFREVLEFPFVDAGHGWLIFALPPSEVAVHPAEENGRHELYLICDDLQTTMEMLHSKGIQCAPAQDAGWGILTRLQLPGGGLLGLYQAKHASPTSLKK
jgi:catechol 2,3-dioxygenase-like lactoylglutathione lyase family enzyme